MSIAASTELPSTSKQIDDRTKFELLVLIERYLAGNSCRKAAAALRHEIEDNGLVPCRIDFRGHAHRRTYKETISDLVESFPSLLQMLSRLSVLADAAVPPSVSGLPLRLINNKRNCLLRTKQSATKLDTTSRMLACRPVPNYIINSVRLARCRELGNRVSRCRLPGVGSLEQMERHYRVLGHLSMVYCVTFDRTGNYILTGADDNLIKVWDANRGLLRYTYRGHSAEVADVTVSYCNQMIASGSVDKSIRVWSLATGATLQVFHIHTAVVARVKFLPFVDQSLRYLVSCALDCKVVFYSFDENSRHFERSKIILFDERDTHCYLRVFRLTRGSDGGVVKFADICAHNDRVDSLEWAHSGCRFASGSRDGVAKVWKFSCGKWRSISLIVPGFEPAEVHPSTLTSSERSKSKYRVTMLCWSLDDSMVVTAGSDYILRVWSSSGGMLRILSGHTDDSFVLKSHPTFNNVVLSCGHDGVMVFWDIEQGEKLKRFTNIVEHRGHSALFDLDISRDGCSVAAVDSLGHLTVYSVASKPTRPVPKQQFFNTDYSLLLMDDTGWVIDEATGIEPHLLPPPLLTDQDLTPLADEWQDSVPGRDLINKSNGFQPLSSPWLTRMVLPPLPLRERSLWAEEMLAVADLENHEFDVELLKEPEPEPEPIDIIVPMSGFQRRSRYRGTEPNPSRTNQRQGGTYRRQRPPTLEEAIAAQDARRAAAEMENYHSDLDDSYSNSESSSNEGSSDSDSSDSDFHLRCSNRSQDRDQEETEITTSSGRRVQRPQRADGAKSEGTRTRETRRRVKTTDNDELPTAEIRSAEVEEDEVDIAGPSTSDSTLPTKKQVRQRPKKESFLDSFPDWMRISEPRRFPFIAQLGDHVVYFRQGHEMYLERVEAIGLYPISSKMKPRPSLGAEEFCIVDEVRYVRKPYRLTVVRLSQTDRDGQRTGISWNVKFHDLANVPDFIILKQHYDTSLEQNVQEGDRIEAILDGQWWTGTVNRKEPKSEDFPSSLWFCLRIIWDSGEEDIMSPWDCQPRSGSRKSGDEASEMDHRSFAHFHPDDDWPESDLRGPIEAKELCCARMSDAIEKLSVRETVEPFAYPVSLEAFPDYAANIDYPIDLDTIVNRLRSGFYRRLKSLHQDIRHIAIAAEQFNEPTSAIVRNSRVVVETLIRFSRDLLLDDVVNLYDTLFDMPSDQIVEYCKKDLPQFEFVGELHKQLAETNSAESPVEPGWKTDCRTILRSVMADPCASHFLKADAATNEDLAAALQQTCDLTSLEEALERGDIDQPATLLHNVERMVHACKTSIDDKRSPIYRDSLALGSLFAERMRGVLSQFERIWKNLIDPAGRILRRRSRKDRIQSKYNTRSRDRRAEVAFDPLIPSTSQSGRPISSSPGFYRELANGRTGLEVTPRRIANGHLPSSEENAPRHQRPRCRRVNCGTDPSTSGRNETISTRSSVRRKQLARELSNDSNSSRSRMNLSQSSTNTLTPRNEEELAEQLSVETDEENDSSSSQDDDFSPSEEMEESSYSLRSRQKRKVRQTSEESETTSYSPNRRSTNGRQSTRSGNVSKRRRIENGIVHEVSNMRGRSSRRNTAAINYMESDEDSAVDVSSRGRIRRPRRPVHF
ncbi:Bromodomain and WD repeat-containing protein 3 [Parelaphostrongylus tenuis]|uniref:Bromodomain and WD repeat-containing protein 3 n=1 Tax=Parelaphostrongylus tenuis TaxID=148309 RepID=A0AAD5QX63_PARTN|nr:Bromodomain and WD repeat-containing protein 3 [Parelaphostrongylus tenuis]